MSDSAAERPGARVTGAAGFVGRRTLAPLAARGWRIVGVARGAAPPADAPSVEWRRADLLDPVAVRELVAETRPTHLLAAAWHMGPGNMTAVENYPWIGASLELTAAFAEAGGRRALFVGSCAEYDWSAGRMREDETPLRPGSAYGAAKAALSIAFRSFCATTGVSGVWARPFFMYGPGEAPRRLAADVILSLMAGGEALCSHGRQRRDFLHVADVGDALAALLASDLDGAVNVGSGRAVPIAELAGEIARKLGGPDRLKLGARAAPEGDPALIEADVSRLRDELGWRPRFDLAAGLDDAIAWWRANPPERTRP